MANVGVNAVQFPVPCDVFYYKGNEIETTITKLLDRATNAGLSAILVLVPRRTAAHILQEYITAAASYVASNPTIIALQLPSSNAQLDGIARSNAAELPLLITTTKSEINDTWLG